MIAPALRLAAGRIAYPGGPPVFANLDLSIARGERVAVIGGNGSGKTTLLRALVGLLPFSPGGGSVEVGGTRILKPAQAVAAGVGLVFQNPDDQLFCATVREDLAFGPRNQGASEAEVARRVEEALAALELEPLASRAIDTLSFGEKKRACLAGVLAMEPRVLLLDEPTAGLDPSSERSFVELLARLHRERGLTLLVATHAIDLVPYLAGRVLLLGEGGLVADGPTGEVLVRREELARARLRVPLVTELGLALEREPLPLTVEEAHARWSAGR